MPTGPWRGVLSTPNAFANEAFIDEVAAALKQDPLEFRMGLLDETNPLLAVIELAASKAGWSSPLPQGHGRGLGCQTYHGAIVAMIRGSPRCRMAQCASIRWCVPLIAAE